jgi:hypothetical protein
LISDGAAEEGEAQETNHNTPEEPSIHTRSSFKAQN